MCDVKWFSPKALPSLHCFVSVVVQFTQICSTNHWMCKQAPKSQRKEKQQEMLIEPEAATVLSVNNLVLHYFKINKILIGHVLSLPVGMPQSIGAPLPHNAINKWKWLIPLVIVIFNNIKNSTTKIHNLNNLEDELMVKICFKVAVQ